MDAGGGGVGARVDATVATVTHELQIERSRVQALERKVTLLQESARREQADAEEARACSRSKNGDESLGVRARRRDTRIASSVVSSWMLSASPATEGA